VINANIVGQLVHLMQTGEFDAKRIAALAISSATACGAHDQIR
jgi:importin subunit alpha-6/7